MEPIIVLQAYQFSKILKEKKVLNDEDNNDENPTNITLGVNFSEDDICILEVSVKLTLTNVVYEIKVEGAFKSTDSSMSEEIIEEYLKINGTAILYPYIRSALSVISSLDSESAILLPTLNTNIFKNKDNFEE
jgi:preprotein translocase subunit SecB